MEISLQELANYAEGARWYAHCVSDQSQKGDLDFKALEWFNRARAAERIAADFFFSGDLSKARDYFIYNGKHIAVNMAACSPEELKKRGIA